MVGTHGVVRLHKFELWQWMPCRQSPRCAHSPQRACFQLSLVGQSAYMPRTRLDLRAERRYALSPAEAVRVKLVLPVLCVPSGCLTVAHPDFDFPLPTTTVGEHVAIISLLSLTPSNMHHPSFTPLGNESSYRGQLVARLVILRSVAPTGSLVAPRTLATSLPLGRSVSSPIPAHSITK